MKQVKGKLVLVSIGLVSGLLVSYGWAAVAHPTEHIGLEVEKLGFVSEESMSAQVGLKGHILLLRKITINPGGQIAKHSADSTPGVVYVESGTWTEGRDSGETEHSAGDTFVEDKDTVHWFYNRGDEPAAAYVCDIKPA
jgi:quercetin dioxygenase-like cupin family protein